MDEVSQLRLHLSSIEFVISDMHKYDRGETPKGLKVLSNKPSTLSDLTVHPGVQGPSENHYR